MSKVFIEEASLIAIGDAIRAKTGGTEALTVPSGMVDAIAGIETGGSGGGVDYIELLWNANAEPFEYSNANITSLGIASNGSTPFSNREGFFSNSKLQKIDLPNLETISSVGLFLYCEYLKEVNLPKLTTITGSQTFANCSRLTKICLPKFEKTTSGIRTLGYCSNLQNVQLPSCTELNTRFFANSSNLQAVVLAGPTVVTLADTAEKVFESTPILSGDGVFRIFVPDDLVETYKTATNWSAIASTINSLSVYQSQIDLGVNPSVYVPLYQAE